MTAMPAGPLDMSGARPRGIGCLLFGVGAGVWYVATHWPEAWPIIVGMVLYMWMLVYGILSFLRGEWY